MGQLRVLVNGVTQVDPSYAACETVRDLRIALAKTFPSLSPAYFQSSRTTNSGSTENSSTSFSSMWTVTSRGQRLSDSRLLRHLTEIEFRNVAPSVSVKRQREENDSTAAASSPRKALSSSPFPVTPPLLIPLVVGNVAQWLGPDANPAKSHQWSVYIRGPNNEDLSSIIESVTFVLHETFDRPERVVTSAPFQVTEHGWGEFVVLMVVRLKHMQPGNTVTLQHLIQFSLRPKLPHCVPPEGRRYVKEEMVPYQQELLPCVNEAWDELVVRNAPAALVTAVADLFSPLLTLSPAKGGSSSSSASGTSSRRAGEGGGVTCWNEIKKYGALMRAGGGGSSGGSQEDVIQLTELRDQLVVAVQGLRGEVSQLSQKSILRMLKGHAA